MRNYLSFGGGVNSVALHLLLVDQGVGFESVFVHHGTDWPETYHYVAGLQWWLKANGHRPITILRPNYSGYANLYDYCWHLKTVPVRYPRWCTSNFKVSVLQRYHQAPAFCMIGIDSGESHRAKISADKGIEKRYPLIEQGIDRTGCIKIIKDHDLPVPIKSGCYICPFQRRSQWVQLRRSHPSLFCKAQQLEERNRNYRISLGKKPWVLSGKSRLHNIVNENQSQIFAQDEYPPCECGL
jgi:hypothetical protein